MDKLVITRHMLDEREQQRLVLFYGRPEVDRAMAEYLTKERARLRDAARKARLARREQLDGRPDYPNAVLEFVEGWIAKARRSDMGDPPLGEVTHACRKAAKFSGVVGFDRIQDRGMAKLLRLAGFRLVRRNEGMIVDGLAL
jgi:hypothetical protein